MQGVLLFAFTFYFTLLLRTLKYFRFECSASVVRVVSIARLQWGCRQCASAPGLPLLSVVCPQAAFCPLPWEESAPKPQGLGAHLPGWRGPQF